MRTPGPKPKRQLSIDPFPSEATIDDPYASLLKSPRHASQSDKSAKGLKTPTSNLARPISQLSSAGFFDDVSLEKMPPPPKSLDIRTKPGRYQLDGARSDPTNPKEAQTVPASSESSESPAGHLEHESDSDDENVLPQSLSRLDADVVDFICDVLQEDNTSENHMFEPPTVAKFHNRLGGQAKPLRRKSTLEEALFEQDEARMEDCLLSNPSSTSSVILSRWSCRLSRKDSCTTRKPCGIVC